MDIANAFPKPGLLTAVLDTLPQGVAIYDARFPDLPIVYCNPAFEALSGYSAAELLDGHYPLLQGEDQERLDTLRRNLAEGRGCQMVLPNQRKDGSRFWNELNIAPLRDDQGRGSQYISLQRDVTGQMDREEMLRQLNDMLEDLVEERTHSLSQAEDDYRAIFNHIAEGIFRTTPQGQYLTANPALARILGYDSPQALLAQATDVTRQIYADPERRAEFLALMERQGRVTDFQYPVRRRDGDLIWVSENARRVDDEQGNCRYFEGTVEDITQRRQTEQALRKSEQRFRRLVEQAADAFFVLDLGGRLVDVNQRACDSLGYSREELLARHVADIEKGLDPRQHPRLLDELKKGEPLTVDGIHQRKDGSRFPVESRLGFFESPEGKFILVLARDVSERRAFEDRLRHQATHDALTGLPNRTLLGDRLDHAIAHARRTERKVGVLYLDLDRFKAVNDSLGHSAGDSLLQAVAEGLRNNVRQDDTVARLEGDEFVVLLEDLSQEAVSSTLALKLQAAFRKSFALEGQSVYVSASIGVALFPKDGQNGPTLLRNAHTAMYRAKDTGRDTVQFYAREMNARALERLTLESQLRQALERDELRLHYQPQISLDSGLVIGAEALLRWRHTGRGLVSPGEFIPLAEETGLIVPIGEWVLRSACQQAKDLADQGLALRMAVNLSAKQFSQVDLPRLVDRILGETGLDSGYLELEITESLLMQDVEATIRTLHTLKEIGVHLAIDDFGTGYSSLSYLKRFPIDRLKIDRAFVRDITTSPDDAAIALAVVAMAHSLRLGVVAEGVETEAQAAFLHSRRCDEIQGFYFSRPLPSGELTELLRSGRGLELPSATPAAQRTVLLVDDEPTTLAVTSQTLAQEGYRVLTADTARQGFELLASYRVGVVVSDEVMPEMGGTEFLQRVRDLYPDTVRIVLSGRSDMNSLIGAVNQGAIFKFLDKPVNRALLRATVREAFQVYGRA